MDDAPAPPPPPGGAEDAAPPPAPGPLARVTLGLAVLALVAYAAGALLMALPVRNPPVQDCGAPGAYLYQGRVDVVPDRNDQILDGDEVVTLTPEGADAARATRCQDRVASRAVPAAVLLLGATGVGGVAFAVELLVVRPRHRRARAATAPAPPLPPPGHPEDGGPHGPSADGPDLPA